MTSTVDTRTTGSRRAQPESPGDWLEFDLHGKVSMRVARSAPTSAMLQEMFVAFEAHGLPRHDIVVSAEIEPMTEPSHGEDDYRYTDGSVYLTRTRVQVVRTDGGFRVAGTRELLTTVLPLVDRLMVERDAAMIHALTCDYRGRGVAMPAWGGTGKTSTVAKLLRIDGVSFMGDDWAFLTADGMLLGYAKPMFIKPHHRPIYPHLFAARRKPLLPSSLSRPVRTLTQIVHPLVTQYPRIANVSRHWSPERMMVSPQQAFPAATVSTSAPLAVAIFAERYDGRRTQLVEKSTEWMVSRLVGNWDIETTRHSREVMSALAATNIVPLEQAFSQKAAVLARALADKPVYLLKVPQQLTADQASDEMVRCIQHAVALADDR
jgi:hypothetical protein